MSKPTPYPNFDALSKRLSLDPTDGTLTWLNGPRAGKKAASEKGRGYLTLRLGGRSLLVHRVVFILSTGVDPYPLHIDHINGDSSDNRPENLRAVTNAENIANRTKLNRNNTSGYAGVHWSKAANKWVAKIKRNGVNYHIGVFDNPADAAYARSSFEV